MLNPSKADALVDDSTTTLMVRRAQRDGFQRYEAVNLFALVSTDPRQLYTHHDPIGPENDHYILRAIEDAERIIVAWGNNGDLHSRAKEVLQLVGRRSVWCFGQTLAGQPRFPRALPRDIVVCPYKFP